MVPSVPSHDSNEMTDEEMEAGAEPTFAENESIMAKASSFIKGVFSNNSTIATRESGESDYYADNEPKSVKEQAMERATAASAAFLLFWFGLSKTTKFALVTGAAIVTVAFFSLVSVGGRSPAFPGYKNVAFVGNSYFYANDLPRFVENMAAGHVTQDSLLHNSAGILQVIMTGNGMWNKWATQNAMINGVKFNSNKGNTEYLYDMGACSVPQLLTGHDEAMASYDNMGSYVDDGQNPCFQQDAYREYHETIDLGKKWDFVVITDQSKAMAFDSSREGALMAFNYTYGPILKEKHISPIIVQPHAYSSSGVSSATLDAMTTFTALIMEGAEIYKKYLNKRIGWFNHAHIAPVGNAYLAVYEESPIDLWPKLFLDDGVHPSAYGTFLYGCVIYATMTGYMPKYKNVVVDDMENSDLFASARRLQSSSSTAGFPSKDEAAILFKIAKKVAIHGYKPKSLRGFKIADAADNFLSSNSDNAYQGEYEGENYAYDQYNYEQQYDDGYQDEDYENDADDGNYQQNNYNYGNQNQNYNGNYGNGNGNGNNYQGDYGNNQQNNNNDNNNDNNNNNDNSNNNDNDNNDGEIHKRDVSDFGEIVRNSRNLSETGRRQLCTALTNEYAAYFSILRRAENVNANEFEQARTIAMRNCPNLEFLSSAPFEPTELENKELWEPEPATTITPAEEDLDSAEEEDSEEDSE